MTDLRMEEMINVLAKDPEVGKELLAKTPEEALAWFKAQGMECTMEEVVEFAKNFNEFLAKTRSDELSEDDAEMVAGGGSGFAWGVAVGALATVAIVCCPW